MAHGTHRLTTLAEDLEAIGLLPKTEQAAPAAPKKAAPVAEAKKPKMEEPCEDCADDSDEEEPDEDDMEEGEEGAEGEEVAEGLRRVRTKKGTGSQRAKWRKVARRASTKLKKRKHLRKGSVKRVMKKREKIRKGRHGHGRVRMVVAGMDRVSSLLDDVQKVLGGDAETQTESLTVESRKKIAHAFAQLALTADQLATKFESVQDEDLEELKAEIIADLKEMAEDYGDAALSIKTGSLTESEDSLTEAFESDVRDLLDALEVYDDCTSGKD